MSESGGVTRALLRTSADGWLEHIEEVFDIERAGTVARGRSADGALRELSLDALVSMNMWGFTPAVFPLLREGFRRFLAAPGAATGEYLLPTAIQDAIAAGMAHVRVLDPRSNCFGITYPTDAPAVSAALGKLVTEGRYPTPLFG